MRRFLSATGWYLVGLLTLPLLYAGTRMMVATAADEAVSVSVVEAVQDEEDEAPHLFAETELVGTKPVASPPQIVHPPRSENVVIPAAPPVFVEEVIEPGIELPAVELEPDPAEFAQADAELNSLIANDSDPFSPEPNIRRRELGFDTPPAQPKGPDIVLPVKVDSLANDAALDEAAQAKVNELRETLKKVVEEKAAKLSAAALEAEITLHQRHLSDLNALQELLRLEQGLKELSDKFPESDSGIKAKELLKALEHLRTPGGALHPFQKKLDNPNLLLVPHEQRSEVRRSRPNPFAFDQQHYKWLRGVVGSDRADGQLVILYDDVPDNRDPYHGRLKISNVSGFPQIKSGDTIYVEGEIDTSTLDRRGKPAFKVRKFVPLRPKI